MAGLPKPDGAITIQREMGLSHAEFFRLLPSALEGKPFSIAETTVTVTTDARRLTIRLAPEEERRIALLRLPVTRVSFQFEGYTTAEVAAFMGRFERYYQRGGG